MNFSFGQDEGCGTIVGVRQRKLLEDFHPDLNKSSARIAASNSEVAIVAHIVTLDDGSGGLTDDELDLAIEDVNAYFSSAGLHFFVIQKNYIQSTKYFDLVTSDELEMTSGNDIGNTINIYFVNSIETTEALALCGFTYLPLAGPERMVMDNDCAINGSTLPHEMGHFFSLLHTHGLTSSGTDELVDGSNCIDAGDEICDTPADPVLSLSKVSTSCEYIGTETDVNGDPYLPNVRNLMSYAPKQCRDEFSAEQYARMSDAYLSFRSNLYSTSVVALLEVEEPRVCVGNSIEFTNASLAATSLEWTFEGGNPPTSTEENPIVSYNDLGTYNVRIIATSAGGERDTLLMQNFIQVEALERPLFVDRFEDFVIPGIEVINPGMDTTFVMIDSVGFSDSYSAMIPFYNYPMAGEVDYLKMGPVNTEINKVINVDFEYAYTYYDDDVEQYYDELQIVYRFNCDKNWTILWQDEGVTLATAAATSAPFVPSGADWRHVSQSLVVADSVKSVEVALRTINGYGNNLYIDDFNVFSDSEVDFGTVNIKTTQATCHGDTDGSLNINVDGPGSYKYSLDNVTYNPSGNYNGLAGGQYLMYIVMDDVDTLMKSFTIVDPDSLIADYQIDVPSCSSGGAVNVIVSGSGGTGIYEYALDGGAFGGSSTFTTLSNGAHTAHVRDVMGCLGSVDFSVQTYDSLIVTGTKSDILCYGANDGLITLDVTGGLGEIVFLLNGQSFTNVTGFSGLKPGNYEVVVSDETLCEWSKTFQISEPAEVDIVIGIIDVVCANKAEGSITAIASGGNGTFQYSLDTGRTWNSLGQFAELYKGEYTLLVSDSEGCEYFEEVTIDGPDSLYAEIAVTNEECYGSGSGSISISPSGGTTPYSLFFDDVMVDSVVVELSSGSYLFEMVDQNGCYYSELVNIFSTFDSIPTPEISVEANIISVNPQQDYEIVWYRNGQFLANENGEQYEVLQGGLYEVAYLNAINGCESIDVGYEVPEFNKLAKQIAVGPNPVKLELHFLIPPMLIGAINRIKIFDISGDLILSKSYRESIVLNQPPGLYFVVIEGEGFVHQVRVLKE
ncbi:M43 family zinc metalloprotease [Marinoscillum sp. MHG1-6]|uniref:M43 family zinc metalloprotease n=1 Tax=Marinoscillum sp. MHG1-6 TaxID=2959627 RepID=UPI00215812BE|nr:M43 family zinc metalloprotease [Marinoscillum sp. MHG1-6]